LGDDGETSPLLPWQEMTVVVNIRTMYWTIIFFVFISIDLS